jgi:two-component system, chemotaxis family, protein-glutamate methylesterase/glutaminase
MPGRDVIVVGGSAGSLAPLITLVQRLPRSFPACVLVVVHSSADSAGGVARILERDAHVPISIASDGDLIRPGVFVAPPDHHLVVTDGHMRVTHGPKENGFRPAIDPLFRTAADAYGPRVIGVLLSGALDDGEYGLSAIKASGGLVVVQDPDDAEIPSMPRNAIEHVVVDHVLPATAIAPLLCRETDVAPQGDAAMDRTGSKDPQIPGHTTDIPDMNSQVGPPSGFTCPDCGGALWQIREDKLVRFQCHVGHRYSPESLLVQQDERVEAALWTAVRSLEERAELRQRMAEQTEAAGMLALSESFDEQAQSAKQQANQIRDLLARLERAPTTDTPAPEPVARRKRPR